MPIPKEMSTGRQNKNESHLRYKAAVNSFPGKLVLAGAEASQMSIFELPNGGVAVGV